MVMGLLFTFVSLLTISGKSKRADESSITLSAAVVEDEGDSGNSVADYTDLEGNTKSAKEMHVFPITNATIYF
jgi:hypothetical protein